MQTKENFSEHEHLSPYEWWQLNKFGNILNNCNPDDEPEEHELTQREINHIFYAENFPNL